jgi:hypothetical protein
MQVEDRTERKGRGYEKIIYNTEVYIIQNDGFLKKMGMKEEEENARNIYNTEVYITQNYGLGKKMGLKEMVGDRKKIIYNTEIYIVQNDGFGQKMGLKEEKVKEG